MIKIDTKRFGEMEIDENQVINFPYGLPGFEDLRSFALMDSEQEPFYWLQSMEDVNVAFILINPFLICPNYEIEVLDDDFETIALESKKEKILIFSIVSVRGEGALITANLKAPLIINRENKMGRQFISEDINWDLRFDIMKALQTIKNEATDAGIK